MTARRKLADKFDLRHPSPQPRFKALPAADEADSLPHDRAVWKRFPESPSRHTPPETKLCVEYASGSIELTTFAAARWSDLWTFWRFGWPPIA